MNLELLKRARAIIAAIPTARLDLAYIADNADDERASNDPNHCGTIACGMGWLGMHPEFMALGLVTTPAGELDWKGEPLEYADAGSELFDITWNQALVLFGTRAYNERRPEGPAGRTVDDKAILLNRLDELITKQESLNG